MGKKETDGNLPRHEQQWRKMPEICMSALIVFS